MLELAQRFVVDASLIAQANGGVPFHTQQFSRQIQMALVLIWRSNVPQSFRSGEPCQTIAVMLSEIFVYLNVFRLVVLFTVFQILECSLENDAPRLLLFGIRARNSSQSEQADQWWQSESL